MDANTTEYPTDPYSHWYPYSQPIQSSEVNDIANWVTTLRNVIGFIDLRRYGQMSRFDLSLSGVAFKKVIKKAENELSCRENRPRR